MASARFDSSLASVRRAFGDPKPPAVITQKAFDFDDGHYRRMCSLRPGERPRAIDLLNYALDLQYQEALQPDLFRSLFPSCLEAWRDELYGFTDYAGFVDEFNTALVRGRILERMLQPSELAAVASAMRAWILEAIDRQRGLHFRGSERRAYKWIRAVATYGVLQPDVESLWVAWWNLESVGRAIAAIQYISCLMYETSSNPIFDPWTREAGGGPPTLWEYGGFLYEDHWKLENVAYLERALEVSHLEAKLVESVARLVDEPEHVQAKRVLGDWNRQLSITTSRCAELPKILATRSAADVLFEWKT